MDRSPQNEYAHNPSSEHPESPVSSPRRKEMITAPRIFVVVTALFAVILVYAVYQLRQATVALERELEEANAQLSVIKQRLDENDSRVAQLTAEFRVSSDRLGLTQAELDRALTAFEAVGKRHGLFD